VAVAEAGSLAEAASLVVAALLAPVEVGVSPALAEVDTGPAVTEAIIPRRSEVTVEAG